MYFTLVIWKVLPQNLSIKMFKMHFGYERMRGNGMNIDWASWTTWDEALVSVLYKQLGLCDSITQVKNNAVKSVANRFQAKRSQNMEFVNLSKG